MKEPKCTITQIKAEIERLRGTGFKCAIEYLQAELERRKGSSRNRGRPVKYNDEKRVKNRESARKSREKKAKAPPTQVIVPFEEA